MTQQTGIEQTIGELNDSCTGEGQYVHEVREFSVRERVSKSVLGIHGYTPMNLDRVGKTCGTVYDNGVQYLIVNGKGKIISKGLLHDYLSNP